MGALRIGVSDGTVSLKAERWRPSQALSGDDSRAARFQPTPNNNDNPTNIERGNEIVSKQKKGERNEKIRDREK